MTNNWQTVKLSEVTEYINRGVPPVYIQDNSGTVVINQKCVRNGQISYEFSKLTDESARKIPQDKLLQPLDILINSTGTGTVGRVGQLIQLTQRATVDSHVTIVRPKKEKIDPIYLGLWLKSRQDELENLAEGSSNQVELSRDKISNVKVILPSLNTQMKVAAILSSIDEAIQKTDRVIQKSEELKSGLLNEFLTKGIGNKNYKKTKIGKVPEDWEIVKLGTIVNHIGSGVTPKGGSNVYTTSGIPFIRSQNVHFDGLHTSDLAYISSEIHNSMKRSQVRNKDVLLNITGASIGRCTIVPAGFPEANVNQHVCIIRVKENLINPEFVKYFLQSEYGQKQIMSLQAGGNRQGLNYEQIRQFDIPLSNDLNEQLEIVKVLNSVDKYIQKEKQNKDLYIKLKIGLMHDIFNQKVKIN